MQKRFITVNDKMQRGYRYARTEPAGRNFAADFRPELTPAQMLRLGVFCGKYLTDCRKEFPPSWFARAKLAGKARDCALNYFGVNASQPLSVWRKKAWIYRDDPRGWFQWYCRYYMGRRIPAEDARQIKRWNAIRRHVRQIQKNCEPGDVTCRPRQRQALLHWAYDSRKIYAGSKPFALITLLAAGVVRNSIAARPASGWLALVGIPAVNIVAL